MGIKLTEIPKDSGHYYARSCENGDVSCRYIGEDKKVAAKVVAKMNEMKALQLIEPQCGGVVDVPIPSLKEYVWGWKEGKQKRAGWVNRQNEVLKASTIRGYKSIIIRDLVPVFGNLPVNKITKKMVIDHFDNLYVSDAKTETIRNIRSCLSAILRDAANAYDFENPVRGIKIRRRQGESKYEPNPFTFNERAIIEKTFKENFPPMYYPMILCGSRAGLRIGEIIGLRVEDVLFDENVIFIRNNVTNNKETTPKSASSIRKVRMTSELRDVLMAHLQWSKSYARQLGLDQDPIYVFFNRSGHYLNYGNFARRVWKEAIKRAGLERRILHDLRHTYATLRLSMGHPLAEVSKELGHSNIQITYNTYYRWIPSESVTNIDDLDRVCMG